MYQGVENIPKHYQLKQIVLNDIKNGKYQTDTPIPSTFEFMKQYKVSNTTVRHMIGELSREGIIYTIQGKGCFVADIKTKTTTTDLQLQDKNRRIVFIAPHIMCVFYSMVSQGIMQVTQGKDYNLEIYNTKHDYNEETRVLAKCLENPVSGIIFVPSFSENSYRHLIQLENKRIPIVLLDVKSLFAASMDFVGCNNLKGAKDAVNYLIKLGHKKIAFIGKHSKMSTQQERFEGYKKALKKNRISFDPSLTVFETTWINYGKGVNEGFIKTKKLLEKNVEFTAVFAMNDELAIGAMKALKENNIKVPQEVSVIGFDDMEIAQHAEVPLTTVKQDAVKMGFQAAKLLLKKLDTEDDSTRTVIDEPQKVILPTKLIIRESTAEVRGQSS